MISVDAKRSQNYEDFSVSELIEAHERFLRAESKSPRTIDDRTRLLRALHEALPFGLAYASTEELSDWLQHDPTWKPWTRATYAMHIRGFYRWARGRFLEADPSLDMAKPRRPESQPRPVSDEELAHALRSAPEPWYTIIMLAAYGGLRLSEAAGLRRQDVTEEDIWIRSAKGGDSESIATHPLIWQMVRSRPAGPLAYRTTGRPATANWLASNERAFFDGIGQPQVVLHRFRHWYGTTLLTQGIDMRVVQVMLRHKNVSSTQGYTLVRSGQRRLAIRLLPAPAQHPSEN